MNPTPIDWKERAEKAEAFIELAGAALRLKSETLTHTKKRAEMAEREIVEHLKYQEVLCADLCKMEDALGFKQDCVDKQGAFIPTIGPWLERVRDLIAAEGELGDARNRAEKAESELANLRVADEATQSGLAAAEDELGRLRRQNVQGVMPLIKSAVAFRDYCHYFPQQILDIPDEIWVPFTESIDRALGLIEERKG